MSTDKGTFGRPLSAARLSKEGSTGAEGSIAAEHSSVLDVLSSAGSPLDEPVRADMETWFGHDFSGVRVHTDEAAHRSALSVNAHAYTVGSHIAFRDGAFDPSSTVGRTVLAHELTHVLQQRSGPIDGTARDAGIRVSDPSDRLEREADATAQQMRSVSTGGMVARLPVETSRAATDGLTVQRQGAPMVSSGSPISSGMIPASFATPEGLPAFRYNLPNISVATATVATPEAVIELELFLRGNVQATPKGSIPGVSIDQTGLRLEANNVVDGLSQGMRINGVGSSQMSIGTTWGTELVSNEIRFTPPNRFAYIGQNTFAFDRLTPAGIINFRGQVGFELRATVTPLPPRAPRIVEERTWWERNWGYVVGTALIVGAGLLVVGTIVEDVVTGGVGIADDPVSFSVAAGMASAGAAAF